MSKQQDTRDFETRLRQDLGLLEGQIRDMLPIVDALYLSKEEVAVAIGPDEEPGRVFGPGMPSFQRDSLRHEIRQKLGINAKDEENDSESNN